MATSKELSMTEPLLIPCPHCNGLNRIPGDRLGEHPKSWRCKNEE